MKIDGHCPACRHETLEARGGKIYCDWLGCPLPTALQDLIDSPVEHEHFVTITAEGFVTTHPIVERLNNDLVSCELHAWLGEQYAAPRPPGRYVARRGILDDWIFSPAIAAGVSRQSVDSRAPKRLRCGS